MYILLLFVCENVFVCKMQEKTVVKNSKIVYTI